jgi:hypothetical protein
MTLSSPHVDVIENSNGVLVIKVQTHNQSINQSIN